MKKLRLIISLLVVATLMVSCKNNQKKNKSDENQAQDSLTINDDTQITLTKITGFPAYNDVKLKMEEPADSSVEPGEISFKFDVENMKLGEQTKDAGQNGLANSEDGQHIHFIIDNEPYMAFYEDDFKKKLDKGVHTLVAFPARSYHMSVKNKDAYVAKKLTVGDADNDQFEDVDFSEPTLVYSRPKGTYKGDDTNSVLLDFYLLNTDLGSNGNKVRATINGQEFILDDWAPYAIEGLPMGKNTVKLELIDKDGNPIKGAFNSTEREFTLEK